MRQLWVPPSPPIFESKNAKAHSLKEQLTVFASQM
jgi:hypothetical protein